jgi:hypothetical protein
MEHRTTTKRSSEKWKEQVPKKVLKGSSKLPFLHPDELRFEEACTLISTCFIGNFDPYNPPDGLFLCPPNTESRELKECEKPTWELFLDRIFTSKG